MSADNWCSETVDGWLLPLVLSGVHGSCVLLLRMSAGHRDVRRGTPGDAGCNRGPFVKKLSSAETSRGRLDRGLAAGAAGVRALLATLAASSSRRSRRLRSSDPSAPAGSPPPPASAPSSAGPITGAAVARGSPALRHRSTGTPRSTPSPPPVAVAAAGAWTMRSYLLAPREGPCAATVRSCAACGQGAGRERAGCGRCAGAGGGAVVRAAKISGKHGRRSPPLRLQLHPAPLALEGGGGRGGGGGGGGGGGARGGGGPVGVRYVSRLASAADGNAARPKTGVVELIPHTLRRGNCRAVLRRRDCWQVADVTSGLAALTVRAVPLSHRHCEERLCQAVLMEGLAATLAVAQHDVVVELVLA